MIRNLLFRLRWHRRLAKHKAEFIKAVTRGNSLNLSTATVRMRGMIWRAEFSRKNESFFLIGEDR